MELFRRKWQRIHGIILDNFVDGSDNCKDCDAACCRGFPSVKLTELEYGILDDLGAKRLVYLLDGSCYLLIEDGCEFLIENMCSIYEQRPAICRRFTCQGL